MKKISLPFISKIMKTQLKMSYKKVSTRPTPTLTKNYSQNQLLAAKLILALQKLEIPIIFLDEYSIDQQYLKRYNWVQRGKESYIIQQFPGKPRRLTAAITKDKLLYIQQNYQTNNQFSFCRFLKNLRLTIIEQEDFHLENSVLFFDNATFHKTGRVIKTLKRLGLPAITNCPYTPELNACEYYILAHKQKLAKQLIQLKPLTKQLLLTTAQNIGPDYYKMFYQKAVQRAKEIILSSFL